MILKQRVNFRYTGQGPKLRFPGTSAKKADGDVDLLWASKGGNVDLSKWSKDDFSTGLIPDYIDCKCFAGKPEVTKNFVLCFTAKEKFC